MDNTDKLFLYRLSFKSEVSIEDFNRLREFFNRAYEEEYWPKLMGRFKDE